MENNSLRIELETLSKTLLNNISLVNIPNERVRE